MPSWLLDKFKKMAERKAQREMRDGGKVYYVTGGRLGEDELTPEGDPIPGGLSFIEEANRKSEAERLADRRDARADGFRVEGDESGSIMGVTLGSETTNRVGGVAPEEATMYMASGPGKSVKPEEEPATPRRQEYMESIPKRPANPLTYELDSGIKEDGVDIGDNPFERAGIQFEPRGAGLSVKYGMLDGKMVNMTPESATAFLKDIRKKQGKKFNMSDKQIEVMAKRLSTIAGPDAPQYDAFELYNKMPSSMMDAQGARTMGYGGKMPRFGVKKKRRG